MADGIGQRNCLSVPRPNRGALQFVVTSKAAPCPSSHRGRRVDAQERRVVRVPRGCAGDRVVKNGNGAGTEHAL
jgi:hypothetical protein